MEKCLIFLLNCVYYLPFIINAIDEGQQDIFNSKKDHWKTIAVPE